MFYFVKRPPLAYFFVFFCSALLFGCYFLVQYLARRQHVPLYNP